MRTRRFALMALVMLAGCRPAARDDHRAVDSAAVTMPQSAEPRLAGTPPAVALELPPATAQALAANDAAFATRTVDEFVPGITQGTTGWSYPWSEREAPFAVLADFDGDGTRDVAVLQRSTGEARAVAVLGGATAPRVVELRRWSRADAGDTGAQTGFYLRLQPAGTLRVPDFGGAGADTTVTLAHDGIQMVAFGQAARTYWYSNGAFTSLTTAD